MSDADKVSWIKKAVNFTLAVVKHTADGLHSVSDEDYVTRLDVCNECEHLSKDKECNLCGCPVGTKAMWRSEKCPAGKWPALPRSREAQEGPSEARGGPPAGSGGCGCGGSLR